jgi:hypothetical protein
VALIPDEPGPPKRYRVNMSFTLDGPSRDEVAHLYVDGLAQGLKHNKPEVSNLVYDIAVVGLADRPPMFEELSDGKEASDTPLELPRGD